MSRRRLPIVIAGAAIIFVTLWLASQSVTGFLSLDDEHYTAERSREMLILGPWTVHENFAPSAVKPPLQYWLDAFALARLTNPLLALRLWPLVFAAGAAVALYGLARVVDLRERWVAPLSVVLLFTCPLFLRNARSATLDAGLIFFSTLFLLAAERARIQPRWWLLAGICCWLGALQKAPVILLLWLIIIALRAARDRKTLREVWLWSSLGTAIILMSVWPIMQTLWFHLSLVDLLRLHEPFAVAARRAGASFFDVPFRLSTTWPCGGFAIAACLALPLLNRTQDSARFVELSHIGLLAILLSLASNTREVNYLGPIIPLLCLVLARALCLLARARAGIALSILVGALALAGLPLTQLWINRTRTQQWKNGVAKNLADHAAMARALASAAGDRALVVIEADNHMLVEDFYLFYGKLNRPLTNSRFDTIPPCAIVAISTAGDFEKIAHARELARAGDVICWALP
jgi:4-amino-4-deoxy-L-arabinose transferase-like glycosyltransferase